MVKKFKDKNFINKLVFVGILKVNDENRRLQIHTKISLICNTHE